MPALKQRQADLSVAKAEIVRLQQRNASLRERLVQVSPDTELPAANPSVAARLPESPQQHQPFQKQPSPPDPGFLPPTATKSLPHQATTACTLSPHSANQGFKCLYAPIQCRIPIS